MFSVCSKFKNTTDNSLFHKNEIDVYKSITDLDFFLKSYEFNILFQNISNNIELKIKYKKYKLHILRDYIKYIKKNYSHEKEALYLLYKIEKQNNVTEKDKTKVINILENKEFTISFLENYKVSEIPLLINKYISILHLLIISLQINKKVIFNFYYKDSDIELINNNNIYIYLTDKDETISDKWLLELVKRYIFINFLDGNNITPDNLHIFLINFDKRLIYPKKENNLLLPAEINTGVTNKIDIIITRKNECLKTILHELIHFHSYDFIEIPEYLLKYLKSQFKNVESDTYINKLNIFESYTEAIASIFHILLLASSNNLKTFDLYIRFFKQKFSQQILYTYNRCQYLLNYLGIIKINSGIVKEKTNCVSYFFIKSYLYYWIDELLLNCSNQYNLSFNRDNESSFYVLYKIIKNGVNNKNIALLYLNIFNLLSKDNMKLALNFMCIKDIKLS